MSTELLFGMIVGGAWVLREIVPLLFKRPKSAPDYLPKDEDKRREDEWWSWRRETVNKRLDAHAEELRELRDRVTRLEALRKVEE